MSNKKLLIEYEIDFNRRKRSTRNGIDTGESIAVSQEGTISTKTRHSHLMESLTTPALQKKNLLSPILRSPSEDLPENMDWQTTRKYKEWKDFTQKNSAHLHEMIDRLDSPKNSDLNTKERSVSPNKKSHNTAERPTSPYLKSAKQSSNRPHTAHVAGATDSFARAINGMYRDIEKMKKKEFAALSQPRWDDRFVFGKTLTPVIRPETSSVHLKHKKFVEKMSKYRKTMSTSASSSQRNSRRYMSASAPNFPPNRSRTASPENLNYPRVEDEVVRSRGSSPVKDTLSIENVLFSEKNEESFSPEPSPAHPAREGHEENSYDREALSGGVSAVMDDTIDPRLFATMEKIWKNLVECLHAAGREINYQDILEVGLLREPPEVLPSVIGYIAILMGLKPFWKTIKSTILKEFLIFQNFTREVDPLEIPVRRVKKAFLYKEEKLKDATPMTVYSACKPAGKIMR